MKLFLSIAVMLFSPCCIAGDAKPFAIHVVDEQTGRGVPLVELTTPSNVRFYTDSAGYAAIDDPAMVGQRVFFTVWSHGYDFPADGFGSRGRALELTPGGEAELKIKRLNIAERLYRVTGEGIYRDTVILGKPVPIAEPLINGQVTGQDSVQCAIYKGKIWWFWGDTGRQSYPLGQFSTSGATSALPGQGGLDPSAGVNLTYFVDKSGFSRPMVPSKGGELHWVDGITVVKDDSGRERMIGTLLRLMSMAKPTGKEMIVFNDATGVFDTLTMVDLKSQRHLRGHPFHHTVDGIDYLYCGEPFANQRVKADWKSVSDPGAYEAYLPQRNGEAKLTWVWQKGAEPIDETKGDETPFSVHDMETGRAIRAHYGSVRWNEFRKKWVMIFVEQFGKPSFLGEAWYAEADAPEGPWRTARKIVTHEKYSFYNPVHHEFFDREGGRYIYFEGTYSMTFSRENDPTPRYDYNQMMYRLDLSDERLHGKAQ